jgi:hypothetical protein
MSISPEMKGNWPVASLPFFAGWDARWWVMVVAAATMLLLLGGTMVLNEYARPVLRARAEVRVAKIRRRGKKSKDSKPD